MTNLLLVAAGGALGAVLRYGVGSWLTPDAARSTLPWGTMAANLIGCFLIGAILAAGQGRGGVTEATRLFVMIGVLGGFTTFSAFGLETFTLLRSGASGLAAANVLLQVAGGLVGVWAGWTVFR